LPCWAKATEISSIQSARFLRGIPAQVISRQQVPAAQRLRALSFPMRAGNARERAECALTTHLDAHHGGFLWIIRANWQLD
jgi:hypothetical protein